ncbi:MAG TPA: transglutaminase family protein [Tepidisphaeraceae bacterium]|jgi:uncharacterized protein (DUF2126 family)/transglutaminase-like putative cysteine protease
MSIRIALNHKTRYRYARDVWLSPHVVRLRPAPHCRTPIVSYSLKVTPGEHFINWQQDPYANRLARLVFPKKARELAVEVDLVAEMTVINPFDFFIEKSADRYPFTYEETLRRELAPYLHVESPGPLLCELVALLRRSDVQSVDYLVELNGKIKDALKYLIRLEPGVQTPEESLTCRSGSCRDSAWLLVRVLRELGIAARFVSGYLVQLAPDLKALDGPSGTEVDFTDLHAWAEAYIPGAGWIGLDPTSGLLAGEGHIPLAASAEPTSAAAITGFYSVDDQGVTSADPDAAHANGQVKIDFEFAMSVKRIHEAPRVTKPYTDAQWRAIDSLGHRVDADLQRNDVRLTMGGEPTFVSIDEFDAPEWNTAALGGKKYPRSLELIKRIKGRVAPTGLLHHGQGKWYPGEPLPRWALGLYFRKDGQPVWRDETLTADDSKPGTSGENDARAFIRDLAERLGVNPRHALPGHEDAWYYLWKERRLPTNVDPFESNLDNKQDRERLAKVFEQGLDKVVGYALPLRRERHFGGGGAWRSGLWQFRSERMYLIPGDSPMGYRLPLDSIGWVAESEFPHVYPQDPWAARGNLPDYAQLAPQRYVSAATVQEGPFQPLGHVEQRLGDDGPISGGPPAPGDGSASPRSPGEAPRPGESAPWVIRTALCTQVRNGHLRVFMPPQRYAEDYLELVAAVEDTARALKLAVLIEGYTPPADPRLDVIRVTPDPGVIEVNTAPARDWKQLVDHTTALYEDARQSRLGTEKFMLDGRHTGTGGGNHIIVGGETPADSPVLRRPDLLKSLVGYWHNHPSLSYVFSGMFVGPTSQAPRVDEARNDQVYELEIAFRQIPITGDIPPWLVDRVLRNLLIDPTGNTHRAEFCIDKLYSPDGSAGRLGLLELRAFEMPPHARMSLTQQLMLRTLIAMFWKQPYDKPLVRWRSEIHDRFLLPHFAEADLDDVCSDMARGGYPFEREWLAPHLEFRYPVYGRVQQRGVELELRQAIEPWNVLGEEQGAGGTVRFVDSSVERVQVKVRGMTDSRHVVTCNGRRVPLHPTGVNGEFVAGVRYRAWHPASCLHPTIPSHAPLTFDLVDTWSDRSIGGCTYHVAHPGGRNYATFPVNANEAEGRRLARFFSHGHTPGPMRVADEPRSAEFPFTLDLRRA